MTPMVKTEIVYAEEIYLNGAALSSSNRRLLESADDVPNDTVEELRREMLALIKMQQAHHDAQIDAQQATIDALKATNDAQQATNDALKATNDAHEAAIQGLQAGLQATHSRI